MNVLVIVDLQNSNQGYSLTAHGLPPKIPKCKPKRKSDAVHVSRSPFITFSNVNFLVYTIYSAKNHHVSLSFDNLVR